MTASNASRAVLLIGLSPGVILGCSSEGNSGRTMIGDDLAEVVPWVKGRAPVIDESGAVVIPDEPIYPPIASGKTDPGSGPYDCSALSDLEFSREHWFETFEADARFVSALGPPIGVAAAWSSFDDSSDGVFRMPVEIGLFNISSERHGAAWGLPAQEVEGAPSCNGEKNDWVLHFRGGRFNRFGGGMGHPFAQGCAPNAESGLCARVKDEASGTDNAGFPLTDPNGDTYNPAVHDFWDISSYDGISFWARRGPESEAALGVVVFDKYNSEDLNRQNETYCRRLKACRSECLNREPCSESTAPTDSAGRIFRCYDPEKLDIAKLNSELRLEELFPRCGVSACTFVSTYADPEFEGKACRPYTFQSNESGEFCYDEEDPTPPETSERCGDGYGLQIVVTPDWKFHKISFKEMRQFGHGKVQPKLDLTTASGMAIVTAKGWMDLYLDNVSFYREVE